MGRKKTASFSDTLLQQQATKGDKLLERLLAALASQKALGRFRRAGAPPRLIN